MPCNKKNYIYIYISVTAVSFFLPVLETLHVLHFVIYKNGIMKWASCDIQLTLLSYIFLHHPFPTAINHHRKYNKHER